MFFCRIDETLLDLVEVIATAVKQPADVCSRATAMTHGHLGWPVLDIACKNKPKELILCHKTHIHPLCLPYIALVHGEKISPALQSDPVGIEVKTYLSGVLDTMP
jgi:hypothetical protein